jgi:hypothetical protein
MGRVWIKVCNVKSGKSWRSYGVDSVHDLETSADHWQRFRPLPRPPSSISQTLLSLIFWSKLRYSQYLVGK